MTGAPRPHMRRPVPPDFAKIAATRCVRHLARHYRAGVEVVRRWLSETGLAPASSTQRRTMPADFGAVAPTMTKRALADHYRAHWKKIEAWLAEAGVDATPTRRKAPPRSKPFKRQPPPKRNYHWIGPKPGVAHALPRDTSTEGRAADHLRRYAPLYRCDAHGRADPKGSHWSYGYSDPLILTPEEMVERARGKGFDADDWKRVA